MVQLKGYLMQPKVANSLECMVVPISFTVGLLEIQNGMSCIGVTALCEEEGGLLLKKCFCFFSIVLLIYGYYRT